MWQRFRPWRRSRPFWGGVLTVLAGLEIIGSMNLELHGGTISIGQEGFTAYLIAFVLMITGPLAWFMPAQRHFYGLVAVFVAIYSLLGVNLGGFFIGMLLGVAGGGLIFAWAQADPASPAEADDEDVESDPKAGSPRHATMIIIIAALSLSVATVITTPGRAGAAPCSAAAGKGPVQGSILGGIVDFFDWLFGGAGGAEPSASPTPSPSPSPSATPGPCPTPSVSPSASPEPSPTGSGPGKPPASPRPSSTPTPSPSPSAGKSLAAVAGQPNVGKRPSRMTGSRVTMLNLVFDGVVELPTVEGTLRVLRFSMSQSDTNDFLLHVYGKDGWDIDLHSSKLTVKGETVYFYTNRFRGNLFGLIPVDYTPDNLPPPIPLPIVFFTNPDVQLVWVQSPVLEAPDLRITLVRS
ncbi:DUF6114 domain-containing protein [Allorhizocola rhizosphaerae]|uniref:DUF6114 domain-containing protein n=1 Tax=Allorhizocola rhizosphaerae TaxID=1872709 RepID=UPI001FE3AD60|nr:DUF6114 domain-containing protein [Allorhizocola rhizosphaerae]